MKQLHDIIAPLHASLDAIGTYLISEFVSGPYTELSVTDIDGYQIAGVWFDKVSEGWIVNVYSPECDENSEENGYASGWCQTMSTDDTDEAAQACAEMIKEMRG